jgi:hypothetical protein
MATPLTNPPGSVPDRDPAQRAPVPAPRMPPTAQPQTDGTHTSPTQSPGGGPVTPGGSSTASSLRFCPSCGERLVGAGRFCGRCGAARPTGNPIQRLGDQRPGPAAAPPSTGTDAGDAGVPMPVRDSAAPESGAGSQGGTESGSPPPRSAQPPSPPGSSPAWPQPAHPTADPTTTRKKAWFLTAGIAVAAIALAAAAVAIFVGNAAPPTQQAAPPPTPAPSEVATATVERYYQWLPGNTDASWALLSPQAQAQSGGPQAYETFWSGIRAVALKDVSSPNAGLVQATVVFTRTDGTTTKEPYQFRVVDNRGDAVIQSFSRQGRVLTYIGIVDIGNVASDPRARLVGQTLNAYFSGINQHDYERAMAVMDPSLIDPTNPDQVASFEHAVSTSNDTDITVTAINSNSQAPSGVSADVTFQSTQDASLGPDGQSCTRWNLEYPLSGSQATSFRIYQSGGNHAAC